MKIPHPTLMRLYGTDDVFFKKASAGPRLADEVFMKLALPMAPGMKTSILSAPKPTFRAANAVGNVDASSRLAGGKVPVPMSPAMGQNLNSLSQAGPPSVQRAVAAGLGREQMATKPGLGVKPPTTAPSPGAAPPRAQTQMQAPAPGVFSQPPSSAPKTPGFGPSDTSWKADPQAARGLTGPALAQAKTDKANVQAKLQARQTPSGTLAPNAPAPAAKATPTTASPAAEAAPGKSGTPWNKILGVGGALGAGALGLGALNSGLKFLGGHGAAPPADYGYAPGGYQVPMGVNGYGAPQPGSRMM